MEDRKTLISKFLSALEIEFQLCSKNRRFNEPIETIFFGGGTPSLLSPSDLERTMNYLTSKFQIKDDAEITMEINPGTIDKSKLTAFKSIGINRLSVGVQSFFDDDLKFLTRIHTSSEAKHCIEEGHSVGFKNISIDLIFSLPGQNLDQWKSNLIQAVELSPHHLSTYSLILETKTPLFDLVKFDKIKLLDSEKEAELYEFAIEFLTSNGYRQYEISNFAKLGFECRHNINYWNHANYLGFGPSAHSFWQNERWWNVKNLDSYLEGLNKQALPIAGGEHLTSAQLIEEAIFLSLRSGGINLENFYQKYGIDFLQKYELTIKDLLDSGKACIKDGVFHLTAKGYVVCDEICQLF